MSDEKRGIDLVEDGDQLILSIDGAKVSYDRTQPHLIFEVQELQIERNGYYAKYEPEDGQDLIFRNGFYGKAVVNNRKFGVLGLKHKSTEGNFDIQITCLSTYYKKKLLENITDDISQKFVGRVVLGYSPSDWESHSEESWYVRVEVTNELLGELAHAVEHKSLKKFSISTQIDNDYLYTLKPYAYQWEEIDLNFRPRKEDNDASRVEEVTGRLRGISLEIADKFVAKVEKDDLPVKEDELETKKSEVAIALEKLRSSIFLIGWLLIIAIVLSGIFLSR